MTQIVVTLENGADSMFLQRMIENMKGVLRTSVQQHSTITSSNSRDEWINKMRELGKSVDSSVIDMNDERTRYIMSK
ncbi:MAG: hypothetical protein K2M02_00785 [Duncaniella sp.]|nr:hypothetical protein [Duncaniella sp.]